MQVTVYKNILGSLQAATLAVLAFPWSPDVVSICNAVAEAEGEPPCEEALEQLRLSKANIAPAAEASDAAAQGSHADPAEAIQKVALMQDDSCGAGLHSIAALQQMVSDLHLSSNSVDAGQQQLQANPPL